MGEYFAYNCTVIGQRYIEKEKPCEDSSVSCNGADYHIAIVADGHGDKNCFRSNVGSRIACQVAQERMQAFVETVRENEEELFLPKSGEKLVSVLFQSILGAWTEGVLKDLRENPPTEEEYASADPKAAMLYRSGRELPHIYGTTLIAMLMTPRFLLVLHQGDGRCVVLHENGRPDRPVPWDPRCEGRATASLCDRDVLAHWRYHIIDLRKDRIVGCYAVSDGIEDSFETLEEMEAYLCKHACDYVTEGYKAYMAELPAHFAALTKAGSQDDISIGCILDGEAAKKYVKTYEMLHEYQMAEGENRRANARLNSMRRKTEYLTERLEAAQGKVESLRKAYNKETRIAEEESATFEVAWASGSDIWSQLETTKTRTSAAESNLEKAKDRLRHAEEVFRSTKEEHAAHMQRYAEVEKDLEAATVQLSAKRKFLVFGKALLEYQEAVESKDRAMARLEAMRHQTEHLTRMLKDAEAEFMRALEAVDEEKLNVQREGRLFEKICFRIRELIGNLEGSRARKSISESNLEAVAPELQAAEEELRKVRKEYEDYMAVRREFVEKAASTEETMGRLREEIQKGFADQQVPAEPESLEELLEAPVYIQPDSDSDDFGESPAEAPFVE